MSIGLSSSPRSSRQACTSQTGCTCHISLFYQNSVGRSKVISILPVAVDLLVVGSLIRSRTPGRKEKCQRKPFSKFFSKNFKFYIIFIIFSPVRVNSNVEAADKLAVVQAIVPTAVRLCHAADGSEHHDNRLVDGRDDDLVDGRDDDRDDGLDDERNGSPDDNEAVVIGQNMLLWGKSNRVPEHQST